jgi:hypothetical protein
MIVDYLIVEVVQQVAKNKYKKTTCLLYFVTKFKPTIGM